MGRATRTFCLLLLLTGMAGVSADDRFSARFSDDLNIIEAELCFDGAAPNRIYRHEQAGRYAGAIRHADEPLAVRIDDDRVNLPSLPDDACLAWTFDLGKAVDQGGYRTAFRSGESVLGVTSLWYWKGPWRRPLVADIQLPEGMAFSAPWPRDVDDPSLYRPAQTPSGWYARSAVGRFREETLAVPGGEVQLSVLGKLSDRQADKFRRWVLRSIDAVTPVFGEFPRAFSQVVVVPIGARSEPVPWAHVMRGGGVAVHFYVDETRPLHEFDADWTATHEFAHLLMPYVSRRDRWLSEGFASYYQNVLRARDGRLSEQTAWQKMYEGFQRGERATKFETLEEATNGGWGGTMRVYWSGAAMMLQADMALRDRTAGVQTLDTALAALRDCCWQDGRLWRGREMLETLDRLTGTDVFMTVYRDNVDRLSFPDVDATFEALGLESRQGRVRLVNDAPLAGVRDQIMRVDRGRSPSGSVLDSAP